MSNMQLHDASTLHRSVRIDASRLLADTGGVRPSLQSNGPLGGALADVLSDLSSVLQRLVDALGGGRAGDASSGGPTFVAQPRPVESGEVIAGKGRIHGDPHFIGQDGGKYDVQGEAGKSYNLLSDADFQMNGRFDEYNDTNGLTVVGQVGIAAGRDQVEVNKNGDVFVNGQELRPGQSVDLADGGTVEYKANGGGVKIESGEWKTDIQFRNKGDGSKAHLNIDVSTDNAVADGVRPHGLLGQTFDSDDLARDGDKGKGTQGGGAIEDANGAITERGDRDAIGLYEVDNVHDRNFTTFNRFMDTMDTAPSGQFNDDLALMMSEAFGMLAQSMMLMMSQSARSNA